MKVGLYSPYLETLGGGERYLLTVGEFFLKRGDKTFLFWDGDIDWEKLSSRFNLNLKGLEQTGNIFTSQFSLATRLMESRKYDLVFFLSDGSIPTSLAKSNILHFQIPFNHTSRVTLPNKIKLLKFGHTVCNSVFTKKYIDRTYGVNSTVLYPPVDTAQFTYGEKENIILSVGRFFAPSNPKKHEVLIDAFKEISKKVPTWRLVLIGGVFNTQESEIDKLRYLAKGYPIQIITDAPFSKLRDYYSRSRIYWHAAGYGEKQPEKAEHFGISTVEAMAAGCVPIVFNGGGQPEIVDQGKCGYLWETVDELQKDTMGIISDKNKQKYLSSEAVIKSQNFSKDNFFKNLERIITC